MKQKNKPLYAGSHKCAWCGKLNRIEIKDNIIKPAVPAKKERIVKLEKDTQKSLKRFSKW